MDGLALKIGEQWAKLAAGTSITITEKSPVFNDGNAFSIPFRLNAEMNRHLLGNATEVEGISFYEAIDRKPATLYVQGIPLFYGVIRLDSEEAAMEDGYIEVNLESGNLTFNDRIDGMNCRDVPLKDKLYIGEKLNERNIYVSERGTHKERRILSYWPDVYQRMQVDGILSTNEVNPYPISPYCNMRICYKMPDENGEGENYTELTEKKKALIDSEMNKAVYNNYLVLGADRKMSSPCFYVLYFIDCLFKHLGISFVNNIAYMEDMCRLAFVNMDYCYDLEDSGRKVTDFTYVTKGSIFDFCDTYIAQLIGESKLNFRYEDPIYYCVANSKNFPDEEVKNVIDALSNGFGIRFIPNRESTQITAVYIRDILRDNTAPEIPCKVLELVKTDLNTRGFKLTYNGSEDDTAYNYSDYKQVEQVTAYNEIVAKVTSNNKTTYLDKRNGNAYRVKIDDDAKSSSDARPALFEVGAFGDATYGDCSDEELTEVVEVGFEPVIMNDVGFGSRKDRMNQSRRSDTVSLADSDSGEGERGYSDDINNEQTFAFFLDVSMKYPSCPPLIDCSIWLSLSNRGTMEGGVKYTQFVLQRYDESFSTTRNELNNRVTADGQGRTSSSPMPTRRVNQPADKFDNKSPIHSYDCGLMLGIMRGPGNESGIEDIEENYDEEGNFKYVMTGKKSAFHSDICDNYNRLFDYNGTEQGGVDVSGRFSLKLRAEKPNPEGGFFPITDVNMQKRGLFDKFYAEYAHFVTHRKLLKMKLRIEMADLLRIDWSKRYTIGQYKGFINRYEYTVSDEGMGVVSLEMYTM